MRPYDDDEQQDDDEPPVVREQAMIVLPKTITLTVEDQRFLKGCGIKW